jgi:hypothetical protein
MNKNFEKHLPPIEKLNLCQNQQDLTDDEHGLVESRQMMSIMKDCSVHIDDMTNSKVQIFDSMDKVDKIIDQMKSLSINPDFIIYHNDTKYEQFKTEMFLQWHKNSFDEKVTLYNKNVCHEVNYFIFKKDH